MRIGVLEWNLSALGGRQKTMMAFADTFKELGHEVRIWGDFPIGERERAAGITRESFLQWHAFKYLTLDDFNLDYPLERRFSSDAMPRAWYDLDVLLVPYGGYGCLQAILPSTRVIAWVIHPAQAAYPVTREIWTNSHTTKHRLCQTERWAPLEHVMQIVRPPHDYSRFRHHARRWQDRDVDVLVIGSLLRAKQLPMSADAARDLGLRVEVVGAGWHMNQDEGQEVLDTLRKGGHNVALNMRGADVARLMGRTKIVLSSSEAESCPLIVYEALNAGCIPVHRNVGAVAEQVGPWGYTFTNAVETALQQALADETSADMRVKYGMLYDRSNLKHSIKAALEK